MQNFQEAGQKRVSRLRVRAAPPRHGKQERQSQLHQNDKLLFQNPIESEITSHKLREDICNMGNCKGLISKIYKRGQRSRKKQCSRNMGLSHKGNLYV